MKKLCLLTLSLLAIWGLAGAQATPTPVPTPVLVKAWFTMTAKSVYIAAQNVTITPGVPDFKGINISGSCSAMRNIKTNILLVYLSATQAQITALINAGCNFICYDNDTDRDTFVNVECDLNDLPEIIPGKWSVK